MDYNDLSPNAGKTHGNNGCDNSNFAMPCSELAYLTRTAMQAFTPPDTTAKRGKLIATQSQAEISQPGNYNILVMENPSYTATMPS